MADNYITTITEKGNINISEDVIATVVAVAIGEIDGVTGLTNSVGNEILELIGVKTLAKGIKVQIQEENIIVDLLVMVEFGSVVTEVAKNVQNAVITALDEMTGLKSIVNVHVSGISFKGSSK